MEQLTSAEEELRQWCCEGDREKVVKLIENGARLNDHNKMNGWTALHWAARRGHLNIVLTLLQCGADKTIVNNNNQTACDVAFNDAIRSALSGENYVGKETVVENFSPKEQIGIESVPKKEQMATRKKEQTNKHAINNNQTNLTKTPPLVVKIRLESQLDFIEVEVPSGDLTFSNFVQTCSNELEFPLDNCHIRKLPNTLVRNNKDISRLVDFQEIEFFIPKTDNFLKSTEWYGHTVSWISFGLFAIIISYSFSK